MSPPTVLVSVVAGKFADAGKVAIALYAPLEPLTDHVGRTPTCDGATADAAVAGKTTEATAITTAAKRVPRHADVDRQGIQQIYRDHRRLSGLGSNGLTGDIVMGMDAVTVRELRNHGGEVLDRVSRGESLIVTRDGTPVATMIPVRRSPVRPEDLIAARRALPAVDPAQLRRDIDEVTDSSL